MKFAKLIQLAKTDSSILLIARLLAMASILLLVRIGGEEPTGVFALIMASSGILAFVLGLGISSNYPYFVGVEKWTPQSITGAAILFTLISGSFGAFVWLALCPILASRFFHDTVSVFSLQLAAISIPLAILESHSLGLLQALNCLRSYAVCSFIMLTAPANLSVCFYIASQDHSTIIYGCILGRVFSGMVCVFFLSKEVRFVDFRIPISRIKRLLTYGFTGYLGGLASLANYRLDRLLIGLFTDPAVVGSYAIISRLAELGRMLPVAIQISFTAKASNMSDIEAWSQTKKLLKPLTGFTVVFMILLIPIGAVLIRVLDIQSASWLDFLVLCFGVTFVASSAPIAGYNIASGRPSRSTYAAIVGLIATLVLAPILIPMYGIFGACITSAIAYLLFGLVLFWLFSRGPARHKSDTSIQK